jgi:L-threonylcarbamoyladenylate synthase
MPCALLAADAAGVAEAARRLRAGALVAFPTETVYGLGASALDARAVARVFEAKGRPLTDPLIVHVPDAAAAAALVALPPRAAAAFAALAALWPGPLTLVARAAPSLPRAVTAGTGWVGVRVPALPLALALLRAAGVPVAAPSANRFGHVSPTRAAHVVADLGAHDDLAVLVGDGEGAAGGAEGEAAAEAEAEEEEEAADGAAARGCRVGIESTVVRIGGDGDGDGDGGGGGGGDGGGGHCSGGGGLVLTVLRRGGTPAAALEAALARAGVTGVTIVHASAAAGAAAAAAGAAMPAPGMALTHYAPDIPAELARRGARAAIAAPRATVVLDYGAQLRARGGAAALAYRELAPGGDAARAARALFAALRWAERVPGAARVLLADPRGVDGGDAAEAVRDRMWRAASGRVEAAAGGADGAEET